MQNERDRKHEVQKLRWVWIRVCHMRLGWVDFSREARKQALDALDTLGEKGTVDELGIGVLRDMFADALFPGTSTIQTRAKYFVLVPCCVRRVMEKAKGHLRSELRDIEKTCCRQMWNHCGYDSDARIIGRRNLNLGEWVQRTPSEIYWAGLRTMGILRTKVSRGLWIAHAERTRAEPAGSGERSGIREEGIRDDEETRLSDWMADWVLPRNVYGAFTVAFEQKNLSPDLTSAEAAFLREQILSAGGTKDSLLAWCLENGVADVVGDSFAASEKLSPFGRFAQSIRRRVPREMADWLDLACAFNRLVFPARVLYNKMLAVTETNAASLWRRIEQRVPEWMEGIDLAEICRRGGVSQSKLSLFLSGLRDAFRTRNFAHAEVLIRDREIAVKINPDRAKLNHPEKIEPGTWVGGGWLDYRLENAGRILRDIAEAGWRDGHA